MANPNPSPDTRFGAPNGNPSAKGRWNKEESISYQYNALLRMSPEDFDEYQPATLAQQIAYKRLLAARTSAGLMDTKEITDRTEGKAPQSIDVTSGGEPMRALVEFADGNDEDNTR